MEQACAMRTLYRTVVMKIYQLISWFHVPNRHLWSGALGSDLNNEVRTGICFLGRVVGWGVWTSGSARGRAAAPRRGKEQISGGSGSFWDVLRALKTGKRPHGRPKTRSIWHLALGRVGILQEELEKVAGDRPDRNTLLCLRQPWPNPA